MAPPTLNVASIVSMPFGENSYVAWLQDSRECLVVDPGLEPGEIVAFLDEKNLSPAAFLCTHGHGDHIGGNRAMKQRWPEVPLVIGAGDAALLTDPGMNLSGDFGFAITSPAADRTVVEGDRFSAAGIELEVLEIPGHSPGHVVYLWRSGAPYYVFGGDVLFEGSIGRTDLPGGDFDTLRDGIHAKLFTLPDDTLVLPGHGGPTTVGQEKRYNPFVGQAAGYEL